MKKTHIHIAVGGRFHADQMAQAFLSPDYELTLFTSYPASRFALLPGKNLRTFLLPEIAYRTLKKAGLERTGEQVKMRSFGKYLEYCTPKRASADGGKQFCFIWSSFAVERFRKDALSHKVLVRDSTHILHQCQVLDEQYGKLGIAYMPDRICVNRELAEYQLADTIIVLSKFAKQTFIERGVTAEKIVVVPLGVDTRLFRPRPKDEIKRPMKAIYFGTLSVRKGIHHLLEATQSFSPAELKLTLVGPVEDSFRKILSRYRHFDYFPAMPHPRLSRFIAQHDLYVFPTLEDGFPNTLVQAMSAGLVPLTTKNNGPAEMIRAGEEGFFINENDPENLRETLAEAIKKPDLILDMRERAILMGTRLPWSRYHQALVSLVNEASTGGRSSVPRLPFQAEASATFRGGARIETR